MDIITGSRSLMGLGTPVSVADVSPYEVWWEFENVRQAVNALLGEMSAYNNTGLTDPYFDSLKKIRNQYFDVEYTSVQPFETTSKETCGLNSCGEMLSRAKNYRQQIERLRQLLREAADSLTSGSQPVVVDPKTDPVVVSTPPVNETVEKGLTAQTLKNTLMLVGGIAVLGYAAYLWNKE